VEVVKHLSAVRQRPVDTFQIAYLSKPNLQARLMEQLLYLWAEDLLLSLISKERGPPPPPPPHPQPLPD
jgi:hypothetical protein